MNNNNLDFVYQTQFEKQSSVFFEAVGEYKKMVLSTSFKDYVSSRMMSIVVLDKKFYFQTDRTFKKYQQLQKNNNAALCIDNIQIEGRCMELGSPMEHISFCKLFKKYYSASYRNYTQLSNERLFVLTPVCVKKWIYEDAQPYEEIFDFVNKTYEKRKYIGT